MVTAFSLLLAACGQSNQDAAEFLGVRLDTCKSWSSGRNPTPKGVLDELVALDGKIQAGAQAELQAIAAAHPPPDDLTLCVARDDRQAQSIGWPNAGAHRATIGRLLAMALGRGYRVRVQERS